MEGIPVIQRENSENLRAQIRALWLRYSHWLQKTAQRSASTDPHLQNLSCLLTEAEICHHLNCLKKGGTFKK